MRTCDPARDEAMLAADAAGRSRRSIAAEHGLTVEGVRVRLRRLGAKPRPRGRPRKAVVAPPRSPDLRALEDGKCGDEHPTWKGRCIVHHCVFAQCSDELVAHC